ncbi:MAG: hypothetical protein COV48_15715 [Elusimicrobia bacterium CG11_big_fil_rev_8_21_14_0_20_64_6]|nr:MAG: hypothetical protein COV48_15715 [Elusimicrobia bacterium CG11_big_fil_rev_8_21_14_0_20_64_6]
MAKKEVVKEAPLIKTTEEMILNFPRGKYTAIPMAAIWVKELKKREENRHLTPAELLDLAVRDVLDGKVDWKDLKKAAASQNDEAAKKAA